MAGEVFTKKYMYIGGGEGGEWEGGGGDLCKIPWTKVSNHSSH